MTKKNLHSAFTLIEVMVAVMIISVVIMALIKMYSNNIFLFDKYKKQIKINEYSSLLVDNSKYGMEKKTLNLYNLVDDFDINDNLRRKLKEQKASIVYQEVNSIDLSEDDNSSGSQLTLEIGKSILKVNDISTYLIRLQIK